ncbi:hypothetical protein EDC94DRAFT_654037 [Helicostylum pulchrum]|nr:hypothetical protein EDC94DRAFT_654037 [Helicostylum pulchrum]
MEGLVIYYQALTTADASPFVSTEYPLKSSYVETPTLYQMDTFPSGYIFTGTKSAAKNRFSKIYEPFFSAPYKAMIAVYMFFVNFLFPIMNKTVCDVSVNPPSTFKRAVNFVLKTSYVVDKDALEKVTATIKCIEMPTDIRDYSHTLVAAVVCIPVLAILLFVINKRKWIAHNIIPAGLARPAEQRNGPGQAGPAEQRNGPGQA